MQLTATLRDVFGKKLHKFRETKVPAIIYKGKDDEANVPIFLDMRELESLRGKMTNKSITIKMDGKSDRLVVIKDYELHPVSYAIEHIDFIDISSTDKVKLDVRLNFINHDLAPGIKYGGVLNVVKKKIRLICDTQNLIQAIDIDLTDKVVGNSIRIKDVILPEAILGYGAKYSQDDTVATILGKRGMKAGADGSSEEGSEDNNEGES